MRVWVRGQKIGKVKLIDMGAPSHDSGFISWQVHTDTLFTKVIRNLLVGAV